MQYSYIHMSKIYITYLYLPTNKKNSISTIFKRCQIYEKSKQQRFLNIWKDILFYSELEKHKDNVTIWQRSKIMLWKIVSHPLLVEHILVQPLWMTFSQKQSKFKGLPFGSAIPLLDIYLSSTLTHKNNVICTRIFSVSNNKDWNNLNSH